MSGVFDQEATDITQEDVENAFPGAELAERSATVPQQAQPATALSPAIEARRLEFRALYGELPWIDSGETAALIAIQIATGAAEDAGKDIESQSVRNLKLVNKVHTIIDFALSDSSMGENSGPDFYARVSAVNSDGEPFSYSIGGWIPLGQLRAKYDELTADKPWRCQITAQPSRTGNPAYRYQDA